jgi:hypothetical protein
MKISTRLIADDLEAFLNFNHQPMLKSLKYSYAFLWKYIWLIFCNIDSYICYN